ncbi:MarR family winged helix-turn-helix transcriptional regulator [Allomesorhizobium alhagi]|uniref:MarR family transcriptional regulator n=1 Tax=Mesorhizobium alhagi CCNWXJ12-2 TaxID=1107882 RepID=H0HYL5_9HYPH|nr:MarR family transcriptional regulator [Mesorhizobium alhagi]EHK54171.1 MarR family transcriptional regulator [Mesorhizobium alhagi CCNWXJ12-2]
MALFSSKATFVEDLVKVDRKLRALFDERIRACGLTLAHARLLMCLAKQEGSTQAQLAATLEIKQASVGLLVDALVKKGFVTRRAMEGNRRAKGIHLTKSAREEAEAIRDFASAVRERVLHDVDERDLMTAMRVLREVARNLGAVS